MKNQASFILAIGAVVLLAALVMLPVSGAVPPATPPPIAAKPVITATVFPGAPSVGDAVTISGTVRAGNLKSGVRIWVFAGNYVNVTTAPVNPDGTYTKTFPTAGLPAATYQVVVQSPGNNGLFNITPEVTNSAGKVLNARTGAVIFTFTGTGSVHDAAASIALSEAINGQGEDDVSARITFPLTAPDNVPGVTPPVQGSAPAAPTARSPLPPLVPLLALAIVGTGAAVFGRVQ